MPLTSSGLRSTFSIDVEPDSGVVVLTDLDDGMQQIVSCSVTNDAENVIRYLVRRLGLVSTPDGGGGHQRVIYRDTMQRWDELQHQDGKFVGFGSLGARTRDEALRKLADTPNAEPPRPAGDDPWG